MQTIQIPQNAHAVVLYDASSGLFVEVPSVHPCLLHGLGVGESCSHDDRILCSCGHLALRDFPAVCFASQTTSSGSSAYKPTTEQEKGLTRIQ